MATKTKKLSRDRATGKIIPVWVVRNHDANGKQRQRTFHRSGEADAYMVRVEAEKQAGIAPDPRRGKVTFGAYVAEWMEAQPHKPSTADTYTRHIRNHMLPTFGHRPLSAIRKTEVQGWVKGLPLAPATTKMVYGVFASVLKAAVADELLVKSPCQKIALPDVPRTSVRVLTTEQVHELAEQMPAEYRALVYLGVGAGLRQGEAFAVSKSRVRFLERKLTVDRQVSLVTGNGAGAVLSSPKTKASNRDVPLPAFVLDAVSLHVALHPRDDLLFLTSRGDLLRRSSFNQGVWKPAVRRAGLPEDVTFHDLRHTYASTALAEGVPITEVSRWLGHASITETVDTYGHLLPEADDRMRTALDRAFAPAAVAVHGLSMA